MIVSCLRNLRARHACAWMMAGLVMPALAAGAGVDERAQTKAAVIAVDQHWLDAEVGGDTAYLEQLLLPAYRSVNATGAATGRADIITRAAGNRGSNAMRRKVAAYRKAHPSSISVVLQGDVAILSFYDPARGAQDGVRSSDVFVHVGGRWRALYSQHSRF